MNFSLNPNSQFTTVFSANEPNLDESQSIKISIYDNTYTIHGNWVPMNISICLPSVDVDGKLEKINKTL